MIQTFTGKDAANVWKRHKCRGLSLEIQRAAYRKLLILDAAEEINDLRIPPGNRLEKLVGNREGQHSIRVNQQWRICFRWTDAGACDVEIVDYH